MSRIKAQELGLRREADTLKKRPPIRLTAPVCAPGFLELGAKAQIGIQRGQGALRHERDLASPQLAPLLTAQSGQLAALKTNLPAAGSILEFKQAQDCQ